MRRWCLAGHGIGEGGRNCSLGLGAVNLLTLQQVQAHGGLGIVDARMVSGLDLPVEDLVAESFQSWSAAGKEGLVVLAALGVTGFVEREVNRT